MHARVTRAARAAAVAVALTALWAHPSAAEENGSVNSPSNDQYSHAASFVARAGGRGGSSSVVCTLPYEMSRDTQAHLEWNSYAGAGGTYSVFLNCVATGDNVPSGTEDIPFPEGGNWSVVWYRTGITPADPQQLAADALARLRPPEAGIHTDPGDGRNSMVGEDTWLWLDGSVYGPQEVWETDGPVVGGQALLAVRIWARPKPGGTVVWNTGDGTVTCPNGGNPAGSCTYEYNRSSAGQSGVDASGDPAYEVTATYAYTGGYEVFVLGDMIDSGTLQDIPRSSQTVLAVAEAQALNTSG